MTQHVGSIPEGNSAMDGAMDGVIEFMSARDDMYAPSGIEDCAMGHCMAPSPRSSSGRCMIWCRVGEVIVLALLGALVGTVLVRRIDSHGPVNAPVSSPRAYVGIVETVQQFWQRHQLVTDEADLTNPYRRALDWIQNVDPQALTPTNQTFLQRYLMAYLYFATSSERHPWTMECVVANASTDSNQECVYTPIVSSVPDLIYAPPTPAYQWLGSRSECEWAGVTCDELHQVRDIQASGWNMSGPFPTGILLVPALQSLRMTDNRLSGSLPTDLVHAKLLERVHLDRNRFTGSLPSSWYEMRNIHVINVAYNQLSGTIGAGVARWSSVRDLVVSENEMTGSLPHELGRLPNAQFLYLNGNRFSGSIPDTLGAARLNELWLHRNHLTGSVPMSIGACTGLYDLRLSANKLNGTLPDELYNMTSLYRLDLGDNRFSGTLSTRIGDLDSLATLGLDNNQFTGTLPTELGHLQQMVTLVASGNDLVGTVPRPLCRLRNGGGPPGSHKVLESIQVNCAVSLHGDAAEIECPVGCCTQCCDFNGVNCVGVE